MSKRQASSRSVNYATSPLLASKTPPWRSHLLVAAVGFAFAGLLGQRVTLIFHSLKPMPRFVGRLLELIHQRTDFPGRSLVRTWAAM